VHRCIDRCRGAGDLAVEESDRPDVGIGVSREVARPGQPCFRTELRHLDAQQRTKTWSAATSPERADSVIIQPSM
jgi:hypothetical protein